MPFNKACGLSFSFLIFRSLRTVLKCSYSPLYPKESKCRQRLTYLFNHLWRAQAELDAANPTRGPWHPDQLAGLPYLNDVIRESMRLWPVLALGSSREAREDLECGGCIIPGGSIVMISYFAIFRSGADLRCNSLLFHKGSQPRP